MSKPAAATRYRVLAQIAFFALFALTPVFDLFRYDLTERHAYFLTRPWHLGIDDLIAGTAIRSPVRLRSTSFSSCFCRYSGTLALIIGVAWKWGRLYCGWLCPHFSVVETINRLMLFATGKHSIWDKKATPPWEPDGTPAPRDKRYWLPWSPPPSAFAFAWALVGLTYLMPPFQQVYHGLFTFNPLRRGEVIFLTAATTVLTLEFLFARHLFCRYACAIGLFQSFAWMGNKKAMVVGFERERLTDCANCLDGNGSACDAVCPMRLKPRNVKRWMFACTQCGQCVSACGTVNREQSGRPTLLRWVSERRRPKRNEARFSALSQHRRGRRNSAAKFIAAPNLASSTLKAWKNSSAKSGTTGSPRPPAAITRRPPSNWPRSRRRPASCSAPSAATPASTLPPPRSETHGARRRWLQRVAGSGEKVAQARRDAETLRLPPEIAAFPG